MVNKEYYIQLSENLQERGVTLVAVSKLKSVADIQQLYDLGQRDFGENYVQELVEKQQQLPVDIRWHFIGHLQSNKIKYIAPFVYCIHAVDSYKLLVKINKQAAKNNREIKCLMQIHIAEETSKYGMDEKEATDFLEFYIHNIAMFKNVSVNGLMGMATFSNNEMVVREEFQRLKSLFNVFEVSYFLGNKNFNTLSMGMSGDFVTAIEEGSTMVRIGSALFGKR